MLAKVVIIVDYYDYKEVLYFLKNMWITNVEKDVLIIAFWDLIL